MTQLLREGGEESVPMLRQSRSKEGGLGRLITVSPAREQDVICFLAETVQRRVPNEGILHRRQDGSHCVR